MTTQPNEGSQTATLATEHTLATITTAGAYVLAVDVANLANGETLTFRIYGKARSSDTERQIRALSIKDAQADELWESIPYATPHHLKFTLEQNGGTGRAFPWGIRKL